jgi:HK97 family phage portal protein
VTILSRQAQRQAQLRGFPISQGGFGGWIGDPSAIPPPSASNMGTAGVVVNERTVLSLMVVSSCIRILGDTSSALEPHVYRMVGNRRSAEDKEVDPPPVIVEPYADMDRADGDFRRVASLGLNGNMMSHVVDRDQRGNPSQVEVLNPALIKVEMVEGKKRYKIGAVGSVIPSQDIVHHPWLSLAGGLVGLNPVEIGVNGFGIPIAAEQYASRYFAQGMHPTGILSVEKPLRPDDAKRVKDEIFTKHGGLAQAHTPIVLDSAAKWQQISITPETAQLLQSRSFSRGEIAGFYGVPNFLVGDTPDQGGPWGKGLQEMVMGFAIFALSGYTGRLDRADTALLPAGYYVVRRVKELFKTNDQMLGTFVAMLRQAAVASPNEARELVGLPQTDEVGADSVFSPVNSAHADFLAAGGEGAETGLPGGVNPKGVPTGSTEGGQPAPKPEGGQQ